MASLLLVWMLASGSYLSEALSQSSKSQIRATKQGPTPTSSRTPLPEVTDMTHGSQHVMDDLATQVSSLQDRLKQVHQTGKDALQKQKTSFEQMLSLQRQENDMVKKQNEDLVATIFRYRNNSANARRNAENLAGVCQKLKEDLQQLQINMSLAQEFAHQTLNTTIEMLDAPEIHILEELDQEDEMNKKDELHRSRLMEIAGEDEKKVAMFQLTTSLKDSPKELLQSLMISIAELSRQQNQSYLAMKANFDMAYQKGVEVHNLLLEEQKKLNATRDNEQNLHDGLAQAVEHLMKARDELSQKLNALRVFHARLGEGAAMPVQQDASAVSLLQTGQKALPAVSKLIKEPKQVLETLNSQISDLAAGLAEKEQESKQAMTQLKADYESRLTAQKNENKAIKNLNMDLEKRADDLHEKNMALRAKGLDLEVQCGGLESDLKALRSNISTAQEFAALALNKSNAMLDNASELTVLDELDDKDAAERNKRLHQEQLKQVAIVPSFLQVSAASTKGQQQPEELLQSLMASLSDLSQEQNVSEASLNATFEQEFQAGEEKHQALLEEQARIKATIAEGEALHEKLVEAVEHLRVSRDGLLERIRSLRSFAKRVAGAEGAGKSLALLQLSAVSLLQTGQKALPAVSKLIKEPKQVLKTLNSQISDLAAGLAEKEQESKQTMTQLKADYESRLTAQKNENKAIKNLNMDLEKRVDDLHEKNIALRAKGLDLEVQCGGLEGDLRALRSNISTAQEFAALAFNKSNVMLDNASELAVLDELDDKDAAERNNRLHQEQLKQVATVSSFLQVSAASTKGQQQPEELLQSLMASLNDLSQEQNVSEASLNATFEQEFQAGEEKHQALLEEQARIKATIAEGEALHEKLVDAVEHLKASRDGLLERISSLRSFVKKVAGAADAGKSFALLQLSAVRRVPAAHAHV